MKLFLVRHGETDYNLKGYFQGTSDIPLNENGLRQAGEIAGNLRDVNFQAAYHSPLQRAKVTCEKILDEKLSPGIDERIKELYFGEWEGVHRDEIKKRWPDQFDNYYSNIGAFEPPGGESLVVGRERAGEFYDEILERHVDAEVLVVAHQFINALMCTHIMGFDISDAWDFRAKPGEVFVFDIDDAGIIYRKLGDDGDSHLF